MSTKRIADGVDTATAGFVRIHGFTIRVGTFRLQERAKELGISDRTLRRAIHRHELSMVRVGDRIIALSEQHVADWLARNERKAA